MNQWFSVNEAAQLLGTSARTIRRQCAAGQLPARRVGSVWQVEADAAKSRTRGQVGHDRADTDLSAKSDKSDTSAAKSRTSRTPDADKSDSDRDAETIVDLRDQLRFMRGVIEQLQRDGAETRQALKRALDLAPKQLTVGEVATTPTEAPQRAETGATAKETGPTASDPQQPAGARETDWNKAYRDIADELEGLKKLRE